MTRIRPILVLTLSFVLSAAGSAHAQWQEQVNRQLEEASQIARDGGLREMEDPRTGSLDEDERESQDLSLQAGNQYMMVAVCDNDCSDIDLRLYDSSGDQVDVDIEMDDTPVVEISPSRSGNYRLDVIMVTCSTEPCFYGVGVYGSGSSSQSSRGGWQELVDDQLRNAQEIAESDGYRRIEENRTGSLDASERESLTLSFQAGTDYMIVGACDQDCSDLDLRLYDPNGNEVDEDIELDDTPIVDATASSSGRYRVDVIMVSCSTEPCFYGVGIYGKGGGAVGSTGKADRAAQAGNTVRGDLSRGDETLNSGEFVDVHFVNVQAGQHLTANLTSSAFDTYLIVRKPSGGTTDNDDYEGSTSRSRVDVDADESGEWAILVTSYETGETGAYELTTSIGGQTVASGSGARYESGTLASGDQTLTSGEYVDVYTFDGRAGEQVVLDLRSTDFDPYIFVRFPEGGQEDNDDHEGDATRSLLSLTLQNDGQYRVSITSYQPGETGAYTLRIEQGGSSAAVASGSRNERGALSAGDSTLRSGEYVDHYDFQGRPGERVRIDLRSSDFDTYLILKDPNGEQQENDDFEGTSRSVIDADINESGTYRVLVTSYGEGETGDYTLAIDVGAPAPAAVARRDVETIEFGGTTSGALESSDGRLDDGEYRDLYVFNGSAGETVRIDMNSSAFDTYLGLISPSGETVENDDHEGSTSHSRIQMALEESGRYRVVATSYAADNTGQYTLELQRGGQAAPPTQIARRQPQAAPSGEGRVYGIFAGISDYGGRASNLAYTAEDAVRVQNAMVQGGNMSPSDGVLLQDAQVTIGNIRNAVRDFSGRIGPNDTFVFFYSGHGGRIPRNGPQPTDPDALDETLEFYDAGITDDEFRDLMGELNAGRILVFLDACFSGGFSKDVISVPGRMGLFSSEEDVTSSVAAKFRAGGYLAVFLADAIGDRLADADDDGQINAIELSQYIHERYRTDLKSGGPGDFVRTGGPQLGHQHLVVDRGSIGPREILFP
jgi:hypothetical protein